MIESFDDIRTYQFDFYETMDIVGSLEGEVFKVSMVMNNNGMFDFDNVQMKLDRTQNFKQVMPIEDEWQVRQEKYVIDGIVYTLETGFLEQQPTWRTLELWEEYWEPLEETRGLKTYTDLLETAQVEVIGIQKVKGVDCYVLQITPEMRQFWQTVMGQEIPSTFPEDLLQEAFIDFTVKQWIAKDTYFLMKVDMDIVMELIPEHWDYLFEELKVGERGNWTYDITRNFLAYNYNQPVSIVLPPEIEEVNETSSP